MGCNPLRCLPHMQAGHSARYSNWFCACGWELHLAQTPSVRPTSMKQKSNQLSRQVETRHSAPRSDYEVNRLNELLRRRTAELAESNRLLRKGIVRYKSMETTLK